MRVTISFPPRRTCSCDQKNLSGFSARTAASRELRSSAQLSVEPVLERWQLLHWELWVKAVIQDS